MAFRFGDLELDPRTYELRIAGEVQQIEPQVFTLLLCLIEHRDRVVTKEELLAHVWGDRIVGESALTTRLKEARRAIGDDGVQQRFIRTVHGRGYRFVGDVVDTAMAPPPVPAVRAGETIELCTADDGTFLAYSSLGDGPPIVACLGRLNHLEQDWDTPVWRQWIDLLAPGRRLVRYDERGGGLSQWEVQEISVERSVRDLEAIVDAAGLERFALFGLSYGAIAPTIYAARHPERVDRLVVCGTPVVGPGASKSGDPAMRQELDITAESLGLGWSAGSARRRRMLAMQLMPGGDNETWEGFTPVTEPVIPPENLTRWLQCWTSADLTRELPGVSMPTLVLQSRHDPITPYGQGRLFAKLVPNGRFVDLDSSNHLPVAGEPAWSVLRDEIERFLASA